MIKQEGDEIKSLKLISPIPVSVNHYLKPRGIVKYNKKGRPYALVIMYETAEAKKYKKQFANYIKEQAKLQGWKHKPNKTQHFYVDCVFYFDRIDMDSNNYFKLLMDAITDSKIVWLDDNVACERVQGIFYDKENPRIEIAISPVDYIGVFKSQEQLDRFEINCIQCRRYLEGRCSILKKAIEGRIQEEIQNNKCKKFKQKAR